MSTCVVLVDDHRLLAQSLQAALRAEGLEAVRAPLDDVGAVLACVDEHEARIVLLDLDLGGAIGDGLVLVAPLVARGVQVVVVTGSADRMRIATAVEAGAQGYVGKAEDFEALVATVLDAVAMQELLSPVQRTLLLLELHQQRQEQQQREAPFRSLSPRENAVLAALAEGEPAAVIAKKAYVSEATVRAQIRAVLGKLGVGSQLAAVAAARRAGWLTVDGLRQAP